MLTTARMRRSSDGRPEGPLSLCTRSGAAPLYALSQHVLHPPKVQSTRGNDILYFECAAESSSYSGRAWPRHVQSTNRGGRGVVGRKGTVRQSKEVQGEWKGLRALA